MDGRKVRIDGLTVNVDLNHRVGTVVGGLAADWRLTVKVKNSDGSDRLIRVRVERCTLALQPIGCHTSNVDAVLKPWATRCAAEDPNWWEAAAGDLYKYLEMKANRVVNTKRSIKAGGWAFAQSDHSQVRRCLVYADGFSEQSQTTVLGSGTPTLERWWPCIVVAPAGNLSLQLGFYCPALAIMNARPWRVHASRVRIVETPGPQITEIFHEPDEQDGWAYLYEQE